MIPPRPLHWRKKARALSKFVAFLGLLLGVQPCRFEPLLFHAGWFTVWLKA